CAPGATASAPPPPTSRTRRTTDATAPTSTTNSAGGAGSPTPTPGRPPSRPPSPALLARRTEWPESRGRALERPCGTPSRAGRSAWDVADGAHGRRNGRGARHEAAGAFPASRDRPAPCEPAGGAPCAGLPGDARADADRARRGEAHGEGGEDPSGGAAVPPRSAPHRLRPVALRRRVRGGGAGRCP